MLGTQCFGVGRFPKLFSAEEFPFPYRNWPIACRAANALTFHSLRPYLHELAPCGGCAAERGDELCGPRQRPEQPALRHSWRRGFAARSGFAARHNLSFSPKQGAKVKLRNRRLAARSRFDIVCSTHHLSRSLYALKSCPISCGD